MKRREFIKQKILSAKWLMRNLFQRNDTLERIARSLPVHQQGFFVDDDEGLSRRA